MLVPNSYLPSFFSLSSLASYVFSSGGKNWRGSCATPFSNVYKEMQSTCPCAQFYLQCCIPLLHPVPQHRWASTGLINLFRIRYLCSMRDAYFYLLICIFYGGQGVLQTSSLHKVIGVISQQEELETERKELIWICVLLSLWGRVFKIQWGFHPDATITGTL